MKSHALSMKKSEKVNNKNKHPCNTDDSDLKSMNLYVRNNFALNISYIFSTLYSCRVLLIDSYSSKQWLNEEAFYITCVLIQKQSVKLEYRNVKHFKSTKPAFEKRKSPGALNYTS